MHTLGLFLLYKGGSLDTGRVGELKSLVRGQFTNHRDQLGRGKARRFMGTLLSSSPIPWRAGGLVLNSGRNQGDERGEDAIDTGTEC